MHVDQKQMLQKALLCQFHKGKESTLTSFLPDNEREALNKLPNVYTSIGPELLSCDAWIKPIHYSWLADGLAKIEGPLQSLFLSLLPIEIRKKSASLLKTTAPQEEPALFIKPLIAAQFKEKIIPKEILPSLLLPVSPLHFLLEMKKEKLVALLDYLGLYDLVTTLRQIVDKQAIKRIHDALNAREKQALAVASRQPAKWIPPKIEFDQESLSTKGLHSLLHKRGLTRLAKALIDEDKSFVWHLVHKFDIGRGTLLMTALKEKHDYHLSLYFKEQIITMAKESAR